MLRTTIAPLLLLIFSPIFVILLWMIIVHYDGSLVQFASTATLDDVLGHWPLPTWKAAKMVLAFATFQLLLLLALPGKKYLGPVTPSGHQPQYKLNGVLAYLLTYAVLAGAQYAGWIQLSEVYDHFGELLITLNVFAIVFCLFLYFKGLYWPSSKDSGRRGNVLFDYFQGTELHPQVGPVSLKQWINCRISMTGWTVIVVAFAAKDYALHGSVSTGMLVAAALQWIYILKFFIWESGYFGSLDIMHDRFGFYICWGVFTWVPSVYTVSTLYLVSHPSHLPLWQAAAVFVVGLFAIWANYDADAQRQRVRATSGQTKVWGKAPDLIHAKYRTTDGQERQNLLLVSGWWGFASHFHYVLELLAAAMWVIPVGFNVVLPWFYFIFLTILLVDRAGRDDKRCAAKYGQYWDEYRKRVPHRIVPGIF